jgi:PAS domain S-box-containing protein
MTEQQSILIVDDKPQNLLALERTLDELKVSVVRAAGGNEALAAALEHEFALAIIGAEMPQMDGFELADLLRRNDRTRHLPIIFLTGADEAEDKVVRAYEAGAVDFIAMPYSAPVLLAKSRIFLELDQQRRELLRHRQHLESPVRERTRDLQEGADDLQRDISRRKQTEARLRAMAEMLDVAPSSITVHDTQGRFLFANRKSSEIHGWDEREFMALNLSDLDVPASAALIEERMRVIAERGEATFEVAHFRKDRTTIPLEVFAKQVEWRGGQAILSVATDITERKRAQAELIKLNMAVDASNEVIFMTDMEGVITSVNPAFTRLYGHSAADVVGKATPRVLKSGALPQEAYESFWKAILSRQVVTGEIVNKARDGRLVTVESSTNPVVNEQGESIGFLAIQHDITRRKELEAQFRQAQKMESVGQLVSGIAHDFNNLLTVINGTAELLLALVSHDDQMHADVQEIFRAGERAAALTRQLLAFSRQQILEPRVLNVNTVVAGMESLLRRLLGEDIDLVVVRAPGVGHVKADPGQLEQVIVNLTANARDAMPQGGRLTLETENVEIDEAYARVQGEAGPPGSYVRLTVSDSGVGMDEATRVRIFEPFFTTKGLGKGTGLGLSTVYGIVKQSEGFISVYSEVGRGTSFKIYLPQVTEAADTDRPGPTAVSSSGTETILLVEDNAGLRKLATRVLKPAGYTVLEAASGEEALAVLAGRDAPVHLLLTDVVMPGMGGRELVERLAETWPEMKVLYMSGYTSDVMVRHGVLEGQMSFLNKPFTAAALLRTIREVLDSPA